VPVIHRAPDLKFLSAGDGVFRFSVGVEDPDDACADLEQALEYV